MSSAPKGELRMHWVTPASDNLLILATPVQRGLKSGLRFEKALEFRKKHGRPTDLAGIKLCEVAVGGRAPFMYANAPGAVRQLLDPAEALECRKLAADGLARNAGNVGNA
jgi:hypothetical protein